MTTTPQTAEYTVTGMTCANCERHVSSEVSEIAGVLSVEVSKDTGLLRVTSSEVLSDADVLAAVDEAGYEAVRRS